MGLFINSCRINEGRPGASNDISDSKSNGVFISEYKPIEAEFKINDTLGFEIEEAWLEKKWVFGNFRNKVRPVNGYYLNINLKNPRLKGLTYHWRIGKNSEHYLRLSSENSLISDFNSLPGDTIIYSVYDKPFSNLPQPDLNELAVLKLVRK